MPYKEFDVSGIGKIVVNKRRGNRSLRLSVTPEGQVRVSIPYWTPYQAGLTFAMSRRTWVTEQQQPALVLLTNGMSVGKTRTLYFKRDSSVEKPKTNVRASQVVITLPAFVGIDNAEVQSAAQAACWRALKQETLMLITPRLKELATTYNFTYSSISVKRMKTRWGSCDQKHNLVFNLFLVQLPWEFIDYVILHELTHTLVLNHGPNFWKQLELVLPNARHLRRNMRKFKPTLMSSMPADTMTY